MDNGMKYWDGKYGMNIKPTHTNVNVMYPKDMTNFLPILSDNFPKYLASIAYEMLNKAYRNIA